MTMQVVFCFFLLFGLAYAAGPSPLRTEFEWKYFDYAWKSADQKNRFIKSGNYDFRNMTPIDVDRSAGKIFCFSLFVLKIKYRTCNFYMLTTLM